MNALKTALVSLLTGDATLASLAGTTVRVYDKLAPQATTAVVFPYAIVNVQGERPDYTHRGTRAKDFQFLVKWLDKSDSSKRAGQLDERTEELLSPNSPLVVPGWRTGFQARTARVDFTETSSGVNYQHVGGIYRITLIPV